MPKVITVRDPLVRSLLEEGCQILAGQEKPNIAQVAKQLSEKAGILVPYHTLRSRFQGRHHPYRDAHTSQQLLTPAQEEVLVEWITFLGSTGHPLSKCGIRHKACALCGVKPSPSWIYSFLDRHLEVKLSKPSGLDPKCAQAFNRTVVADFFTLLKGLIDEHQIPLENIWNMDEKGCQLGGGRKNSAQKYFFLAANGLSTRYAVVISSW
jgi:hypothetical protein